MFQGHHVNLLDWIGLDLFNDDTRPSGHISRPCKSTVAPCGIISEVIGLHCICLMTTHILQDILAIIPSRCIVQVWGLVEVKNCISSGIIQVKNCTNVWPFISHRRSQLLAKIPLYKPRELSRKDYSGSQLCSICHDFPVTQHTPRVNGQCLTTMVKSIARSLGQDMGLSGFDMANLKSCDNNFNSSG